MLVRKIGFALRSRTWPLQTRQENGVLTVRRAINLMFASACIGGCGGGLELGGFNRPPEFGAGASLSVEENQKAVGSVSATDPDGDTISYSVLGVDSALFQVEETTGALQFLVAPDFESPADVDGDNVYEVIVRGSDARSSSDNAIQISVKDLEELRLGPYLPLSASESDYKNFETFSPANFEVQEVFSTPERLWSVKMVDSRFVLASSVSGHFYVHDLQTAITTDLDLNPLFPVFNEGQGGVFDFEVVALANDTRRIYFTASVATDEGAGLAIHSLAIDFANGSPQMSDYRNHIQLPSSDSLYHFGGAIKVVDNAVYVSHGDRLERAKAQSTEDYNGKILRLVLSDVGDLSPHPENQFLVDLPMVFSMGHRNPQGMERVAFNNTLIATEHGPQGGDEINVLERQTNYGWPRATFGEEYGGGEIGEQQVEGLQDSVTYYLPSIAPRAIRYVSSNRTFPALKNSLLIASLKFELITALRLDGVRPKQTIIDLSGQGRISGIDLNDDGEIFVATHSIPGRVLKITNVVEQG